MSPLAKAIYANGFTQKKFAARIGAREESVSRWASGKSKPRPDSVGEIAQLLGKTKEQIAELVDASIRQQQQL